MRVEVIHIHSGYLEPTLEISKRSEEEEENPIHEPRLLLLAVES